MADGTSDDVYDDVENILAESDDTVHGSVELPADKERDLSQTPYLPEKDTGIEGEDRGAIDELGPHNDPDAGMEDEENEAEGLDDEAMGQGGEDAGEDVDADRLSSQIPTDERDGTDPV